MDLQYGDFGYSTCVMSSLIRDKKAEKRGGFSAQFSRIIIFSLELYLGDQLCSKYTKNSFISYSVNEIQAYKDNILMTLQSSLASKVTVIAGILVCIMVGLPIDLPYAPRSLVLQFCICEYFEKLTKLVTYRRYLDRRNLSMDLQYGDFGYSTCVMPA